MWVHVDRLKPRHRDVIRLRFGCGLGPAAIAVALGLPSEKSARDLTSRALHELRTMLDATPASRRSRRIVDLDCPRVVG
ncbi:sigma factor-like helix-turn-helix DNA-binding protein [Paludisphaera mucosa]|uniref:sigma factor-like helix-turn-helix DNA-binding protein n=1 Tax=Paludisphaera mucosa TaxID=3030827 RepID=UPI0034A23725